MIPGSGVGGRSDPFFRGNNNSNARTDSTTTSSD